MACNIPYYLKPYFWLIILTIILFIVFIIIIETNKSFTFNESTSMGIWVLFFLILLFFFASVIWYYYDVRKNCEIQPVKTDTIQPEIYKIEPVNEYCFLEPVNEYCSLEHIYEEPNVMSYINDDYLPMSALRPY